VDELASLSIGAIALLEVGARFGPVILGQVSSCHQLILTVGEQTL
jgi:hypothetical protein